MNSFFDELGGRFATAAARRGFAVDAPALDPAVAQERRFAPLASFMAGVAAERLRQAGGPSSPEAVAELLREVRTELER